MTPVVFKHAEVGYRVDAGPEVHAAGKGRKRESESAPSAVDVTRTTTFCPPAPRRALHTTDERASSATTLGTLDPVGREG